MGLFSKRTADPDEIERLKHELAEMGARLNASESAKQQLDGQVRGISERLDRATPPPPKPPAPKPTVEPAEIDKLNALVLRLTTRLDELDRRVTSISTELANQITEIGGDLETMGGNEPPSDQLVEELRDAQTRLAGEQARYQIAFRQDLAELADRLKRG